jgi:hypothetical protein
MNHIILEVDDAPDPAPSEEVRLKITQPIDEIGQPTQKLEVEPLAPARAAHAAAHPVAIAKAQIKIQNQAGLASTSRPGPGRFLTLAPGSGLKVERRRQQPVVV